MATKQKLSGKLKVPAGALRNDRQKALSRQILVEADIAAADNSAGLGTVSGYYREQTPDKGELRVDVDAFTPQMHVSGLVVSGIADRLHWIAKVKKSGTADTWSGDIWFRDGVSALLPQTSVELSIDRTSEPPVATVRFNGGGAPVATRVYRRSSPYFHPVEFEFDVVQGTTAVTSINTCAHPNRPAGLACEKLSIETVFRRAGFDVSRSEDGTVPLSVAGSDRTWSDTEMHDAMQTYWSRFANQTQWALWVLFAAQHDQGSSLGGIMFDSIGPNHRQGTAIFNDSFIAQAPAGDPAPAAWVERMRFWTACHEMGHAFNLAHSWQKALQTPWVPLSNEPEVRSFMNYPFRVTNGQTAFFSDFAYRFSEQELLFTRHAPERYVQMGNADWFDHHAFEQADVSPEPKFRVDLRINRPSPILEFLEPCMLEIKLTNISDEPQLIGQMLLRGAERMVVIIKKAGRPARRWLPFARYCYKTVKTVLEPQASRYESLFVGAGRNGWDLAEPGLYTVQVALRFADTDYISNPLRLRVAPPRGYEEEYLAQDFLTEDVGRVLAFDGTRALDAANNTLRETAERLPDRAVAYHALLALGRPLMTDGKVLDLPAKGSETMQSAALAGGDIKVEKARPAEARQELAAALLDKPDEAAQTLGHVDYKGYTDELTKALSEEGDSKAAVQAQDTLHATLAARHVAPAVLAAIKKNRDSLATG